jgi:hypothetical protein
MGERLQGLSPVLEIRLGRSQSPTRERHKMEVIGLLVIMGALVAPALILPVMFVVALVKG